MYGSQAVQITIQIFLLAFILRRVSEEAYGIFGMVFGLQQMLYLMRDAVAKGCVTHVARNLEQKKLDGINGIVSSASGMLLIPGLLAAGVAVAAAGPIAGILDVAPSLQDTARLMVILVGVNLGLVLPLYPFQSIVEACQRYDLIVLVRTLFRLARAGVIVGACLLYEPSILVVAVATMLADIGTPAVLGLIAHRLVPTLRVRPRFVSRAWLGTLVAFGSFLFYAGLARIGSVQAGNWVIGTMLGTSFVTYLIVVTYLMNVLKQASQTMTLVIVPVASRYHARKDEKTLGELLIRSTRYGSLATWPITAALAPMMGPVFALWLKPEWEWLGPLGVVVGVCAAACLPSDGAAQIVIGMGDSKRPFYATAAGGLLGLAVTVSTIAFLGWELNGAVLGTCTWLAVMAVGYTMTALRQIRVSRWRFFWEGYLQLILPAVPAALACGAVRHFWGAGSWLHILSGAAAAGVVYVLCFLPFVTRAEWDLVRRAWNWLRHNRDPALQEASP